MYDVYILNISLLILLLQFEQPTKHETYRYIPKAINEPQIKRVSFVEFIRQ